MIESHCDELLAKSKELLSREHFLVEGTWLEAGASPKSFNPRGEPTDDQARSDVDSQYKSYGAGGTRYA